MDDVAIIREVTDLAMLRLTADVERYPELAQPLELALGFALPVAGRPSGEDVVAIWRGPGDFLIVGQREAAAPISNRLTGATVDRAALLGDAASGLAVFDISGAAADERVSEWMLGTPTARMS